MGDYLISVRLSDESEFLLDISGSSGGGSEVKVCL